MIANFNQWATTILNSSSWDGYREELDEAKRNGAYIVIVERLQDFIAITYFGAASFSELTATDTGIIKLASLFKDVLSDPVIGERHSRALRENDQAFLIPFMQALREPELNLNAKTEMMLDARFALYMNWELPLMWPGREPLAHHTNKEISAILEHLVRWDDRRVKKEINNLKLRREVTQKRKTE